MELVNKRIKILRVARHYYLQYKNRMEQPLFDGSIPRETFEKLTKLDLHTCSEKDVENIIGNPGWTQIFCEQCRESVDQAVYVGQPLDFGSSTALICKNCLQKALALLE